MFCRGLFHRFTLFNIVYIVYIILHCFTLLYIVLHCFLLFTLIYIVLHCGSLQLCSVEARKESNTGLGETEMQYKNNINANTKITQIQIQNATLFGTEIQYRKEIMN